MATQKDLSLIMSLMTEDYNMPGSTQNLTGAGYAQEMQTYQPGRQKLSGFRDQDFIPEQPIEESFSEKEIRIGKRFVELLGGHERAKTLVEKLIESDKIFGLTDQEHDNRQIDNIASSMPDHVEYATEFIPQP